MEKFTNVEREPCCSSFNTTLAKIQAQKAERNNDMLVSIMSGGWFNIHGGRLSCGRSTWFAKHCCLVAQTLLTLLFAEGLHTASDTLWQQAVALILSPLMFWKCCCRSLHSIKDDMSNENSLGSFQAVFRPIRHHLAATSPQMVLTGRHSLVHSS